MADSEVPESKVAWIAAVLGDESADREAREAAYAAIEAAARCTFSGSARDEAVALVVASVQPLIRSILMAPASRIEQAEWTRASQLMYEMAKLDLFAIGTAMNHKDADGTPLYLNTWSSDSNVLAEILAKEPSEWTREDAISVALNVGTWNIVIWTEGGSKLCAAVGIDDQTMFETCYHRLSPFVLTRPKPEDRYVPLALLCLDIVRSEMDTQSEAVIACAAMSIEHMAWYRPSLAKAMWDNGFLDVFHCTLQRFNPIERIGKQNLIPSAILSAFKDVTEQSQLAGVDVIPVLLEKGAIDLAISTLAAYQMLGNPEDASVCGVWWGALFTLEILLASPAASKPIVAKLRSAGVDTVRYLLDNPLEQLFGLGTGITATRIAAEVWGRDDDGGGLMFRQRDIDMLVEVTGHRDPTLAIFSRLTVGYGRPMLNLIVSDITKRLLLQVDGFVAVLVDSLFVLDPEHPRRAQADFDAVAPAVQRDFSEAIAQLAAYPPGREALLRDTSVVEALQKVATEGWTDEARQFAESALAALSDRQPAVGHVQHAGSDQKHIMLSYQWDVQALARRIVNELKDRGYRTWFGTRS